MTKLEQFVEGLRKRANVNPAGPASLPAMQVMPGQTQSVQQPTPSAPTSPGPTTRQGATASPIPPPAAPTGSPMPRKPQLPAVPAPGAAPMPKAQLAKTADRIPGGKGDGKPDAAFNPKQLRAGVAVEKEHSPDKEIRKEISKDHLTEHSDYYSRLASIEPDAAEALKKAELISVLYKAGACGRKKHKKMGKKACLRLVACASDKWSAMCAVSLLKSAESTDTPDDGVLAGTGRGALWGAGIGGGLGAAGAGAGALRGMSHADLSKTLQKVLDPADRLALLKYLQAEMLGAKPTAAELQDYKQVLGKTQLANEQLGARGSFKRLRSAARERGLGAAAKDVTKSMGRGALRAGIAGATLGGTGMLLKKLLSGHAKTEEQKPGEA